MLSRPFIGCFALWPPSKTCVGILLAISENADDGALAQNVNNGPSGSHRRPPMTNLRWNDGSWMPNRENNPDADLIARSY
jgi:hypothetical protein